MTHRLNVSVTGMEGSAGVTYVPSWMEIVVSVALVAMGMAAFALAVRYLPIFPGVESEHPVAAPRHGVRVAEG